MRLKFFLTVITLAASICSAASATDLSGVDGTVYVNGQPAGANTAVAPGDRIKVLKGSVDVVYNNGAAVHILAGQMHVVQGEAPLQGPALVTDVDFAIVPAFTSFSVAALLSETRRPASP